MTEHNQKGKYHHGDLRRALISAAIDILESEGVTALTLRRVARETGVSQAAPYTHFRDKTDLLTAVCINGTHWFGEYMKREADGKTGADYLAGLASGHIHFATEHPALFRLMSTRDVAESLDESGRIPEIFHEGYRILAEGLATAPLDHFGSANRQLDIPLAWAQIYGISNLLIEGRVSPQTYGFDDETNFISALVHRFLGNDA